MQLAIIDYSAGNLTSVQRAFSYLGYDAIVTDNPEVLLKADKVVFPGVGAAVSCMENLKSKGLDVAIKDIINKGTPFLGICIGMQLLFEKSEEGNADCLGVIEGEIKKFDFSDKSLKIPHMGWNSASGEYTKDQNYYFVHSYYVKPKDESIVISKSYHGIEFCAGIKKDNLIAFQFHPEKSGQIGLDLLDSFMKGEL